MQVLVAYTILIKLNGLDLYSKPSMSFVWVWMVALLAAPAASVRVQCSLLKIQFDDIAYATVYNPDIAQAEELQLGGSHAW